VAPPALASTGAPVSDLLTAAAALVALGLILVAASRRPSRQR
jgi:hypothetical protein